MENTKVSALEKQIAEVKRMLEYPFKREGLQHFDGRAGYALSKKHVTEAHTFGFRDETNYYNLIVVDGRLGANAYWWCVDNGLKTEADAYNRDALQKYVSANKERWSKRKAELETELAKVNAALAKYDAMLEELS